MENKLLLLLLLNIGIQTLSLEICPIITSMTSTLTCTRNNAEVSCKEPMSDGTMVSAVCKDRHYKIGGADNVTCINGTWNDFIVKCVPDCGQDKGIAEAYSIGGHDVRRGEIPWQAIIYSWITGSPEHICGGTIITVNIVISAAHCFWNEGLGRINPPLLYEVGVGKIFRDYENANDSSYHYVQKSSVKSILVPKVYRGNERHYQGDIAMVIVSDPFTFSHSVHSVCIDLNNNTFDAMQTLKGTIGKTAGWGVTEQHTTSTVLKTVNLPIIELQECQNAIPYSFQQYLTIDKLCVGYTNGIAVCKGDSGGGLVFGTNYWNSIRWYLRGIVSVSSLNESPGECKGDTYSGFTHVYKHADWIKKVLVENQHFTTNEGCMLPKYPANGRYTIAEYPSLKPGDTVPLYTYIQYSCDANYEVYGSSAIYCNSENKWSEEPQCIQMCEELPVIDGQVTCKRDNVEVVCSGKIRSGTKVHIYCDGKGVMLSYAREISCNFGSWNKQFENCVSGPNYDSKYVDVFKDIISSNRLNINHIFGEGNWTRFKIIGNKIMEGIGIDMTI